MTRGEARADIVVHADDLTLLIENKVYASEGTGQCEKYYWLFKDEPGARFVFLTPSGCESVTVSSPEAKEAWQLLSYHDLLKDLQRVLDDTRHEPPAPGRAAAEQYRRTLERHFA